MKLIEYRRVEFLVNPVKNRIWAVSMPEGELLKDLVSVKRARFCVESGEEFWLNPFGGAYHWITRMSEPYEEEFVRFKEEAQLYVCVFDLDIAHLEYLYLSPFSGELLFEEEELLEKLGKKLYGDFKRFMLELWEYIKED
ncbi:MAG: hypothetical protein N2648_01775 [Aquificaceae bacterium]|nr:hypothetical protein [Aquificaceae bacterium]MCX7989356.1 hypothetical protein [Aquificaceae bacterium]MDW8032916.1 hypothetical protein [Aquificaceae bacterium]MDW8295023.1 hypothetical protein [Aquificaceae bacterium]